MLLVSVELANQFMSCALKSDTSTFISYPIRITLDNKENKVRRVWFHTDPALFRLPLVQNQVQEIWSSVLASQDPLARQWGVVITQTQSILIETKKQATQIQEK